MTCIEQSVSLGKFCPAKVNVPPAKTSRYWSSCKRASVLILCPTDSVLFFAKKATKSTPWRLRISFYEGRAFLELGRNKEAITVFKKVLVGYPYYFNAWYNMALAYANNNEDKKGGSKMKFSKKSTWSIIAVILMFAMISGCSTTTSKEVKSEITIAQANDIKSLDPHATNDSASSNVNRQIYG